MRTTRAPRRPEVRGDALRLAAAPGSGRLASYAREYDSARSQPSSASRAAIPAAIPTCLPAPVTSAAGRAPSVA